MKPLEQVKEFMICMGQDVHTVPTIPSKDVIKLRHHLTSEENDELLVAAGDNDLVEVGDALSDKLYVLMGDFHAYGFGPLLQPMLDEVQRSNMTKLCDTEKEAQDNINTLNVVDSDNETTADNYYYTKVGEKFIIRHKDTHKVMKPVHYSPANLRPIIENYIAQHTQK